VDVIPQAEKAKAQLKAIGIRGLDALLRQLHTSLITNMDNAARDLETARARLDERVASGEDVGARAYSNAESYCDNRCRHHIKTAAEGLENALRSAEGYDLSGEVGELLNGLRALLRSRQASFNAQMELKRRKLSDATIL